MSKPTETIIQRRKELVTFLSITQPDADGFNIKEISQKEICDTVPGYEWNDSPTCHDHCPAIWKDINAINQNPHEYNSPGIIISINFKYWYGNKEETKQYIQKLKSDLMPRLVRMNSLARYFKKHGQLDLFDECKVNTAYIEEGDVE